MRIKLLSLLTLFVAVGAVAQQRISLAGTWDFAIGETPSYNDHVTLPGSMLTNNKGDDVSLNTQWTGSLYDSSFYFNPYMKKYQVEGQMKFPFFLTPEKHYVGRAWYQRTVRVPKAWRRNRVTLFLERPHIETTLLVNGREVGHQMSLSTPHQYDVTDFVRFGKDNVITLIIYNGIENVCVGQDSHSVTDQTQGNWNGVTGRIELRAEPIIWRKRVYSDVEKKEVTIVINEQEYHFSLGSDAQLWDEFNPMLYTRNVVYKGDTIPVTFGLREISIEGRQFMLNKRPIWLRGTVENCCFPLTGYPPTDEESWKAIFIQCAQYGLNHMRFHSYCPPEAAFAAADRLGFYLQPEGPSWPNHGVRLRRGQSIDEYLLEECKRIVDTYGHHPSFVMMAAGNEPAGDWVAWCNDFVDTMKAYDPSRVYCGASVGGGWAWDDGSQYHVKGGARGLDWDHHAPHCDDDYESQIDYPRNYKDTVPNRTPIIAHEQGQWCAFPDFSEMPLYTGAYKARNFEIFQDLQSDNGMQAQAQRFLHASRELQDVAYKYEMERNLRTRDYAGFQLLGLNDYSGQGTALVGPLNVFWQEKAAPPTECDWFSFCAPVVPLARLPRFVYEEGDTLRLEVDMYNAWTQPIGGQKAETTYHLAAVGNESAQGAFNRKGVLSTKPIPLGKTKDFATLEIPLNQVLNDGLPQKLRLTIAVDPKAAEDYGRDISNNWTLWVYPRQAQSPSIPQRPSTIHITDTLDEKAVEVLQDGGRVLITASGKVRYGSDVKHRYLPVFWNTSWFKMRPPHTTGSYIQNTHPVFALFPTDDWQNLNWWELVNNVQVMNLSAFPCDYQPIVQPIDTWHVSRKLGLMIEANVLNGQLLMTTIDIDSDLSHRVVARQLRKSILNYMQSDRFQPTISLDVQTITDLFEKQAPPVNMFTNESPDELKPKLK